MRTFDCGRSLRLKVPLLLEMILDFNSFSHSLQKINKSIIFKGTWGSPFWFSDVVWIEHQFAMPLKGSLWSYLHSLTPSQRCHGLAKDFLLKCDTKTEVCVGQYCTREPEDSLLWWGGSQSAETNLLKDPVLRAVSHILGLPAVRKD